MNITKEFQIVNLIIFSLVILYFNFTVSLTTGDDAWAIRQNLTLNSIIGMYNNWSGRLIAYVLNIFMVQNPFIFKILNSLVMIAMPIVTWHLVDRGKTLSSLTLLILLFMLYDYKEMRTAGIVTTYITYYWSLFANVLLYIIIRRYLETSKFFSIDLVLSVVVGIFVCNSEIGALCNSIILLAIFAINYHRNRTIDKKVLILFLIPIFSILFFLTCPGMHNRTHIETAKSMPEFSSFSLIYKCYLGYSETLLHYFSTKSAILLIFLGSLLVTAVYKGLNVVFLMLVTLACFIYATYSSGLIVKFANITHFKSYAFLCAVLCFGFLVILTIYRSFKDNSNLLLLLIFILLLGLMTRVMMGFSPTLYASNTRTFLYCDFSILISAYYIIKESKTNISEVCPVFLAFLAYPYFIGNLLPN